MDQADDLLFDLNAREDRSRRWRRRGFARRIAWPLVGFVAGFLVAEIARAQQIQFNAGVAMDLTPTTYVGDGQCKKEKAGLILRFQGTNGTSITLQAKSSLAPAGSLPAHVFMDTSCVITDALPATCTVVVGRDVAYQLVLSGGSPSVTAFGDCQAGVVVEHRYFQGPVEMAGGLVVSGGGLDGGKGCIRTAPGEVCNWGAHLVAPPDMQPGDKYTDLTDPVAYCWLEKDGISFTKLAPQSVGACGFS